MPQAVHQVKPLSRPPDAVITVPGSKSHSNRALICAALADGRSRLNGMLFADDTEAMMQALTGLGVALEANPSDRSVTVDGGRDALADTVARSSQPVPVDVRKSGTTGRFMLPLLAAIPGSFVLDGHEQLRARPFGPQLAALRSLGARIGGEGLPLTVTGQQLAGAEVSVPSSISSQYLSGLLLSAPLLSGRTTITVDGPLVSQPYVRLTISTMAAFGVQVQEQTGPDGHRFIVDQARYKPVTINLEPDASAASYFFAAAAITGGRVRIERLGSDTVQGDLRFVDVLEQMGAEVDRGPDWTEVRGPERLRGITVDMADISDTAQTLAVVATFADTPTEMTGIGFIRHKETDRIGAVVTELRNRGIGADETEDGMVIQPGQPSPGLIDTYDDHRMAMSFALLGLVHGGIGIDNPGCVDKTFPDFFPVLERLR